MRYELIGMLFGWILQYLNFNVALDLIQWISISLNEETQIIFVFLTSKSYVVISDVFYIQ